MPVPTAYERHFVLRLDIERSDIERLDTERSDIERLSLKESCSTSQAPSRQPINKNEACMADSCWGFTLNESIGAHIDPLAVIPVSRACRYRSAVLEAVTTSGYMASAVSCRRQRPFNLACEPGVRLALLTLACEPVRKPVRRQIITQGIRTMPTEETLYWYALIRGESGSQALRALRILLSG